MKLFKKLILSCLSVCMCVTLINPMNVYATGDDIIPEEQPFTETEVTVLEEDESLRSEYSKDFIMSDKTMQKIVYSVPVHYNDDGEWKEIDNTLTESKEDVISDDEPVGFHTENTKTKVKFSKKMHKKNLACIRAGDYKITWGMTNFTNKSEARVIDDEGYDDLTLKVLDHISSTLIYEDIMDDVSLRYSIDSLSIKEDIIIDKRQDENTFTFEYSTKNLRLILNEKGNIEARDISTDEIIFIMPKPYMKDALETIGDDAYYTLTEKKEGQYIISITASKQWLNDESRVYPVVIDPVITTNTTQSAIDTTFVTSWKTSANYSTKMELLVGTETSEYGYCRTLVKFDLPALNPGDMIVDARLKIASYKKNFYATDTADLWVNAHFATSPWNISDVTWSTMPSFESDALCYDYIRRDDIQNQANWKQFNITSAVKRWYEGEDNNGIVLKGRYENTNYAKYAVKGYLWPERYNSTSGAYPYISLTYRNNKGIEGYWDYSTASATSGDVISINNYSGNPVVTHPDASTVGRFPVSISHVYNGYMAGSNVSHIGPYVGKGWKLSIQQTLLPSSYYGLDGTAASEYPYVYMDADGTEHYFKDTDEGLTDEDGLGLKLTVHESTYVIKDRNENLMSFNSSGLLRTISDRYGDTITLNYEGNIITNAEDALGNTLTLTADENGYLISISDHLERETSFTYEDGMLKQIDDIYEGEFSSYGYDLDSALTSVTSGDLSTLFISYTEKETGKRVSRIKERSYENNTGQEVRYDRSQYNITEITTSGTDCIMDTDDDVITKLEFDDSGRLKSRYAYTSKKELGAETVGFTGSKPASDDSDIGKLNRITNLTSLSSTAVNILTNHSGESTDSWTKSTAVGTSTFTFASSTEKYLFGQKSFKVNVTASSSQGQSTFYQNMVSVKPNTTYTASAYIKTTNIAEVSGQTNGGAALIIRMNAPSMSSSNERVSEYITGTTDSSMNDGWKRVSVTFTTPSDITSVRFSCMVRGAKGTAYFDGLQLEEGSVASPYNMLENPSFEKTTNAIPDSWTQINPVSGDKITTSNSRYGSNAYVITPGTPSVSATNKELRQLVRVNGSESDTYVLSGWVYGKGVESRNLYRKFNISAYVQYTDGDGRWVGINEFNTSVNGWKYLSCAFDLSDGTSEEKTPSIIMVSLRAFAQPNTITFDGIQLLKKDIDLYDYDDGGNMISEGKKKYTYNDKNQMISATDGIDKKHTYTYDAKGSLVSSTDNITSISENYTYDSYGNVLTSMIHSSASGLSILNENIYDETSSYVVEKKDADGNSVYYSYNTDKGLLMSTTDQAGNITEYAYDEKDRVQSITEGDMSNTITYDDKNRLSGILADGTSYTFGYDDFSNRTSTSIGNSTIASYGYRSHNGDMESVTYGNGHTYSYTYDEYGNIIETRENGNLVSSSFYDSEGTLCYTKDHIKNTMTQYDYDLKGNIIRVSTFDMSKGYLDDRFMYGSEYGYDEYERNIRKATRVRDKTNTSTCSYKAGSLIDEYGIDGTQSVSYSYDGLNRVTSKTLDTEIPFVNSYTYKDSERGENYTTGIIEKEVIDSVEYEYEYDELGNIIAIHMEDGEHAWSHYYTYDQYSQLIREDNEQTQKTYVYEYDTSGNITSKKEYAYTLEEPENPTSEYTYAYSNENWKDQLTSFNGQAITYDEIGNPTSYKGETYGWSGRRLTSIGDRITYTYDSDGLRTSKTVNGQTTTYSYHEGRLIEENGPVHRLLFTYDDSGNLAKIVRYTNGVEFEYYVSVNSRGDVIGLIDIDGTIICRYIYDAWGNLEDIRTKGYSATITSNNHIANINPILYRGYYYDRDTGYYYLNSRYYDPDVGRFISADGYITTGQGIMSYNMYMYCGNNPVNRIDPDGHAWKDITNWFSKTWDKVKTWAIKTFGGEVTTVTTVDYSEKIIPEPMPIVVETGTTTATTVIQRGDSSKPISVYAQGNLTHPIKSSTAGLKLNVSNFTLDGSIGFDDFGISGSWTNGNSTNSFGIKMDVSKVKIGFEYSNEIQWDSTTQTNYTNVSVSGWWILVVYGIVTNGQSVSQPVGAY